MRPSDLATIIYTSGTTGPPKGVELTRANAMAHREASAERCPLTPGRHAMSYLRARTSSTAGRALVGVDHARLHRQLDRHMRTAILMLPGLRPTTWGGVPRIWEKLRHTLTSQGIGHPSALSAEGRTEIRARLGFDRVEPLGGGAAPMPIDVLRYFDALGLPVAEAWRMSESTGRAPPTRPARSVPPPAGPPLPGVDVRLAGDGELLLRGLIVMRGYRDDAAATAEAIYDEGWLHTGDVAHIDDDGYVSIVDRKRELIVSAGGKNMSPANIETELVGSSPLIAHAVAIGDRRPYVVALVVLDDAAVDFAAEHGIDDASVAGLSGEPALQQAIGVAVEAANARLSRVERIKRFAIVPEEWQAGGEALTPTLKVKRRGIRLRYAAEADARYSSGSGRFSPGHVPVR